ncbi:MAG: ceramidase domain-containing protein [Elusimicrobiota bacterium]
MTGCPWGGWPPATMHFCEELTCGWLVQPANAVSSLAFVAVGLWLFRMTGRRSIFALFPVSAVLVGITSFLYHASWTFFFQVFDVSSMFMLSCLLLVFNAWRLGLIGERKLPLVYSALVAASAAVMVILRGRSGETLFAAEVALVLLSEAALARRSTGTRYRFFFWSFGTFLAAFAIWILDVREIVCDAKNHFLQGHAAWHVLNSFCFYFLYRFYRQFSPAERDA